MDIQVGKVIYDKRFGIGTITKMEANKDGSNAMATVDFNGVEKSFVLRFAQFSEPTDDQLKMGASVKKEFTGYFNLSAKPENLSATAIQEIASKLQIELPKYYIDFLKDFPIELSGFKSEYLPGKESITERYFKNTVESIVEMNEGFKSFELDHLIAIGDDGCGNYYAIKKGGEDQCVYFIDHEGYYDKTLGKYVALSNDNFTRLVKVEAMNLDLYAKKIVKDCIAFYESKR